MERDAQVLMERVGGAKLKDVAARHSLSIEGVRIVAAREDANTRSDRASGLGLPEDRRPTDARRPRLGRTGPGHRIPRLDRR